MLRALAVLFLCPAAAGIPALLASPAASPPRDGGAERARPAGPHAGSGPADRREAEKWALSRPSGGFVENAGQWPASVRFRVGGGGLAGWLEDGAFTIARVVGEPRATPATGRAGERPRESAPVRPSRGHAVRIAFEGAREGVQPAGERPLPGARSWLRGADPSRWVQGARAFERVRYRGLLPGVDLVARGEDGPAGRALFAYDLVLAPGAELADVVLRCEGASSVELTEAGELVLGTPLGELRQRAPIAWTVDAAGRREGARVGFRLLGGGRFGFEGAEDRGGRVLVVDPGFQWGSFLGSDDNDVARDIALLPGGEPVVAGYTFSAAFPVSPGAFDPFLGGSVDAFVTAVTRAGDALVFSTFLGGSDDDFAYGLAVTPAGEVVVAGETRSSDFPAAGGWQASHGGGLDAFVARLDAAGSSLVAATFLGGFGDERARGVALTEAGDVVICGSTSGSFPVTAGAHQTTFGGGTGDGFVTRFDGSLTTLLASTLLGGSSGDVALAVAAYPDGSVLVGGQTFSPNFPVVFGSWDTVFNASTFGSDGFLARLNAQHAALFATFLGGSANDAVEAVAVGPQGEAVAAGWTDSSDWPLAGAVQPSYGGFRDAFVATLSAAGTQLLQSTYLGGSDSDRAYAVHVDDAGRIALAGGTWSHDFPTTPWAYDRTLGNVPDSSLGDVFVARIEGGVLDYSTFLGGIDDEEAYGVAIDAQGQVFVTGRTSSFNFPISAGVFGPTYDNSLIPDAFLARLDFDRYPTPYGQGKVHSQGGQAFVSSGGFPSLSGSHGGLWIHLDNAIPWSSGWLFQGPAPAETPFMGGTLLVGPPFARVAPVSLSFFGDASVHIPVTPALVGTTVHYQFWYLDPADPHGIGLSQALLVHYHP